MGRVGLGEFPTRIDITSSKKFGVPDTNMPVIVVHRPLTRIRSYGLVSG
jgi:hypothetical protein